LPDAGKKNQMGVSMEREIREIRERLSGPVGGDHSRAKVAAQDLGDFNIQEVRSMQGLAGSKNTLAHTWCNRRLQENLQDCGSVYDNQRFFLSARTAAAGAGRGRTFLRPASRLRISSRVGRSSDWRISRSRKSERDIPSSAARALSSRCNSDGTFRIWTIVDM
jgi:hypothetical protein